MSISKSVGIIRSLSERPTASARVQPNASEATSFQLTIDPAESITITASSAVSKIAINGCSILRLLQLAVHSMTQKHH